MEHIPHYGTVDADRAVYLAAMLRKFREKETTIEHCNNIFDDAADFLENMVSPPSVDNVLHLVIPDGSK